MRSGRRRTERSAAQRPASRSVRQAGLVHAQREGIRARFSPGTGKGRRVSQPALPAWPCSRQGWKPVRGETPAPRWLDAQRDSPAPRSGETPGPTETWHRRRHHTHHRGPQHQLHQRFKSGKQWTRSQHQTSDTTRPSPNPPSPRLPRSAEPTPPLPLPRWHRPQGTTSATATTPLLSGAAGGPSCAGRPSALSRTWTGAVALCNRRGAGSGPRCRSARLVGRGLLPNKAVTDPA